MIKDKFGDRLYLPPSKKYDKNSLENLFNKLHKQIQEAENAGWESVYVRFNSTFEPYENNMLGDVQVDIIGERKMTPEEREKEDVTYKLAKKLGLSFYEASIALKLQQTGKITL